MLKRLAMMAAACLLLSVQLGAAARWDYFRLLAPQEGPRLNVLVARTNGVAWIDALVVGPSGGYAPDSAICVAVRPEKITLAKLGEGASLPNNLAGRVRDVAIRLYETAAAHALAVAPL